MHTLTWLARAKYELFIVAQQTMQQRVFLQTEITQTLFFKLYRIEAAEE